MLPSLPSPQVTFSRLSLSFLFSCSTLPCSDIRRGNSEVVVLSIPQNSMQSCTVVEFIAFCCLTPLPYSFDRFIFRRECLFNCLPLSTSTLSHIRRLALLCMWPAAQLASGQVWRGVCIRTDITCDRFFYRHLSLYHKRIIASHTGMYLYCVWEKGKTCRGVISVHSHAIHTS